MGKRLTPLPHSADHRWFLQCKYCQVTDMGHETELLAKAKRLCRNHQSNHFLDYVAAEFITLNHAILTPVTEIEILNEIHDQLGCDCLAALTAEISTMTHTAQASPETATSTPTQTNTTKPIQPPKTLLERLKNGTNGTHKKGKV